MAAPSKRYFEDFFFDLPETRQCFLTIGYYKYILRQGITYLKNGTIFEASFSAIRKPCEYNMTCAISCLSGVVMAKLRNNFFKLSGRLDRPAYPGFIVMKMAMSRLTLTCLPTSSIVMAVAEKYKET